MRRRGKPRNPQSGGANRRTDKGRRQILAVELVNRESQTSWQEVLLELKSKRVKGRRICGFDDHPGPKRAIAEVIPKAVWQRCYVHFLRIALDHLSCKAVDDCLQELRWLSDRRHLAEAQKALPQWLECWGQKYPNICQCVEENPLPSTGFRCSTTSHEVH